MKYLAVALTLTVTATAWGETLKTCSTSVADFETGRPIRMRLEVVQVDGTLSGQITENVGTPAEDSYTDEVSLRDYAVRGGLAPEIGDASINMGERLIVHAMGVEQAPLFEGAYRSGIDLTRVRSVRVYGFGEPEGGEAQPGQPVIIEAKDAAGTLLGSFLGGFVVGACQ